MRTTSIVDENGKAKSVAGYLVTVKTNNTYTLEPQQSFFHSKTKVEQWIKGFNERMQGGGATAAEWSLFVMYRDRKSGLFLPGRGVPIRSGRYQIGGTRP